MRTVVWVSILAVAVGCGASVSGSHDGAQSDTDPTAPQGLVHRWSFDDGSGGSAADLAGDATATLSPGATWVAGIDGGAVGVGGAGGGTVMMPASLPSDVFSVAFWARPAAWAPGEQWANVVLAGDTYLTDGFRAGFTTSGQFMFWTDQSGGTLDLLAPTSAAAAIGAWTHIAVVAQHGTVILYVNGNAVATAAGTVVASTAAIGVDAGAGGVGLFDGSVDDLRIYNTALSAADVANLSGPGMPPPPPPAPAIYVSATSGDDSWSGSLAAPNADGTDGPFQTLARAQHAAQNASDKRVGVEGGTYALGAPLVFTGVDSGETWLSYPSRAAAVIDGAGTYYVQAAGVSGLSIDGFVFQHLADVPSSANWFEIDGGSAYDIRWNTFLNCAGTCLFLSGVTDSLIDSNTVNGQSPGNLPNSGIGQFFGAITVVSWGGPSSGVTVSHNLIENAEGGAIVIATGPTNGDMLDELVTKNVIRNVDTNCADCGAIYFGDLGPNTATNTGNQATFNMIYGNGIAANSTKCIYLDAGASQIAVTGNVCAPLDGASQAAGTAVAGEDAVFIHGGQNDTITNNILVAGATASYTDVWGANQSSVQVVGYQTNAGGFGISTGMTGNTFEHNVVYSFGAWGSPLWFIGAPDAPPLVSNNDYYAATGDAPTDYGFTDSDPLHVDPQLADPSSDDYTVAAGSAIFAALGWTALPTDQGPLPYAP